MQWMGAVRIRVQTADKKHHNDPQVIQSIIFNILWSEKLWVLTSKHCFWLNLSIISLSPVKSCLVWIRREICIDQAPFTREYGCKQIYEWILLCCYYGLWTHILVRSDSLKLKTLRLSDGFVFYKYTAFCFTLTDGLKWCGLLVDYCDVFISCLDSHSYGTHSLQRIHWWASDGMHTFLQICSDEEKNSSISWMDWEWEFSGNFNF